MSTVEQRAKLAKLLEDVAKGVIDADTALANIKNPAWVDMPWKEKPLDAALHHLYHFLSDADIREKDTKYAQGQRDTLRFFANYLRADDYDEKRVPGSGLPIALFFLGALVLVLILVWLL